MKKKILSIALACAMVFAFIPTFMISHAATADNEIVIENAEQLGDAIAAQEDGQVWKIKAGTYNLTEEQLAKYADVQPGNSGQGNWYFPIHKKITIIGEGNPTITSNVERPNGVWASQDFLSIWADGVTIEGVTLKCKKEVNKAIEVMAQNFTLKNAQIDRVDGGNSGSIYFSTENAGNTTLESVEVSSWIAAKNITSGTLTLKDTVIDFSDNEYASQAGYEPIKGSNDVIKAEGLTVKVDSETDLSSKVFGQIPNNTCVQLTEDYIVEGTQGMQIDPVSKNITFDLAGHTIKPGEGFKPNYDGVNNWRGNIVSINNADSFTIENGTISAANNNQARNVLNLQTSSVTIKDLALDHTGAQKGAPLIVNKSKVNVENSLKLVTGDTSWYGVNVAGEGAELVLEEGSSLEYTGKSPLIYKENGGELVNNSDVVLDTDENGIVNIHKHEFNDKGECACGELSADRIAADKVDELINAIGPVDKVTLDSEAAIRAAREAYKALTEAQQKLVTGKADLDAAIVAYNALLEDEGEDPSDDEKIDKPVAPSEDADKDTDKPDNEDPNTEKVESDSVKTGDETTVGLLAGMLLLSGAGFVALRRKEK